MKLTKLAVAVASIALTIPAMTAQTASPKINHRREAQQQRIGQGVKDGSLTAAEAGKLERREAGLNREVRNMKSDGQFTATERARVQQQQNKLSNQIYRERHDAQVQPAPNGEVNARQRMQQQRIGNGIQNGSLTAGEAARLEGREAGINREVHNMRDANGGTLTPGERRVVNRQQNRTSRRIYGQKHDGQSRP